MRYKNKHLFLNNNKRDRDLDELDYNLFLQASSFDLFYSKTDAYLNKKALHHNVHRDISIILASKETNLN